MTNKGIKKLYIVVLVITILISTATISFSYFYSSSRGKNNVEAESAKLGLDLKVERVTSEKTIGLLPVKDNDLQSAIEGINNESCVDEQNKGKCQVYKVTVTNTGNVTSTLSSKISLFATGEGSKFTNLKWAEINSPTDSTPFGDIHTMSDETWKKYFVMGPKSSASFYVMVWISDLDIAQNNQDTGNFSGIVRFDSTAGTGVNSTFIG